MTTPALVIFDCDGVLIDSEIIGCRVDAECLAEIGVPITEAEIVARYVGIATPAMLADIEARLDCRLPADLGERMRARILAAFDRELIAIPGVAAVLDGLSGPFCVASSSSPEKLKHGLSLVGLWEYFDPNVFTASQVARGKPAPDLFLFAAQSMGAQPEQCVVIEDSIAGVTAAHAAGMRVIGFVGGSHCGPRHADALRHAGAGVVIATMPELPALLDG